MATVPSMAARRRASTVWATNASSYFSRFSALTFCAQVSGRWIQRSAWRGADQVLGLAHLRREHVGHVRDEVERERDRLLEVPGVHRRHRGVERDQVGHRRDAPRWCVSPYIRESGLVSCHWLLNHFSRPLNMPTVPTDSAWCPPVGRVLLTCRRRSAAGCRPRRGRAPRGGRPCGAYAGPGRASAARADDLADQREHVALRQLAELAQRPLAHVAAGEDRRAGHRPSRRPVALITLPACLPPTAATGESQRTCTPATATPPPPAAGSGPGRPRRRPRRPRGGPARPRPRRLRARSPASAPATSVTSSPPPPISRSSTPHATS